MSIQNYILGNRYGKEAHQLEHEAMRDPFLQDAIDGYDQLNVEPLYYLEKLEKQITKKSGKKFRFLRFAGIFACILVITGLSVVFFLYDAEKDKPLSPEETIYAENDNKRSVNLFINDNLNSDNSSQIIDRKKSELRNDFYTEKDKENKSPESYFDSDHTIYQLLKKMELEENRGSYWNQDFEEDEESTISYHDLLAILSREPGTKDVTEAARAVNIPEVPETARPVNNIDVTETPRASIKPASTNQIPKPVFGEKLYNDYIERNRIKITDSACAKKHGKVILIFKVNENGRPVDIKILRSICQTADQEAVRLLQNGPKWTVSNRNGRLEIQF